jgi:uncharacterized protein (TIGR02266 family)
MSNVGVENPKIFCALRSGPWPKPLTIKEFFLEGDSGTPIANSSLRRCPYTGGEMDQGLLKRQHPRFEVYLPVQCTVNKPNTLQQGYCGTTRYIAQGGAMLLLPLYLPSGLRVGVQISGLPQRQAEIVWSGKIHRTDLGAVNAHGVVFQEELDTSQVDQLVEKAHRQHHPRIPITFPVEYMRDDRSVSGTCLNLSQGGMFINTTRPMSPQSEILLTFTLPGQEHPFWVKARVVWTNPPSNENYFPAGMGVQFQELNPRDARTLFIFLEQAQLRLSLLKSKAPFHPQLS